MCFCAKAKAGHAYDSALIEVEAEATCVAVGLDFEIHVSSITGGVGPYSISYDNCLGTQLMTGISGNVLLTDFCYDTALTQNAQKVTLTITDASVPPCELSYDVFSVHCSALYTCDCCADGPLNINAQASGEANDYDMVYVLTDALGIILEINESGTFSNLSDVAAYQSHAVNVASIDLSDLLIELNALVGSSINDLLSASTPFDQYCYTSEMAMLSQNCGCTDCTEITVEAHPVCNVDGSFTISIDAVSGGDPDQCSDVYTVVNSQGSFLTFSAANLPQSFGTYSYTNQNDKITLTVSDNDETSCVTTYDVLQMNCAALTICDCTSDMPLTVSGQAAANGDDYSMLYVLTDDQAIVTAINQNGEFAGLAGDGSQVAVYAFNVADTDLSAMQQALDDLIGLSISDALTVSQSATFAGFCYTDTMPYEVTTDCGCPQCQISAVDLIISSCSDNGTTSTPIDDFFSFTLDVTQEDLVNFNTGFMFDGTAIGLLSAETGSYGTGLDYSSPMININSIGASTVTLTIVDQDDPSCEFALDLSIPATCSVPNCDIVNVMHTVFPCDDNATPDDPRDDFFGFSLSLIQGDPNSFNTGFIFDGTAVGLSANEMGTYGLNGYSASMLPIGTLAGSTVTLVLTDADDPNCTNQVDISIPELCSNPLCTITADVVADPSCQDAGTPGDPSDDTYSFEVFVSGSNTDIMASQSFSDDMMNTAISYGTTLTYGPFLISAGATSIILMDEDDPACLADIQVSAPVTCSDASCSITVSDPQNLQCSDSGTPADPNDDTYTFDLTVDATNDFPSASLSFDDDKGNTGLAYGSTVSYGPYLISNGPITIEMTDADVQDCLSAVTIAPPMSCSVCPELAVVAFPICSSIGNRFDVMYELASASTFTIVESQANTSASSQPATGVLEDFSYTNQNDKFELNFTDEANGCAYSVEVLQLRCSERTQCNCTIPDPFAISVQASAEGSMYSMLYALVDNNDVIIAVNQTGVFSSLPDDQSSYNVYAFSVLDSDLLSLQLALQNAIVITEATGITPASSYSDLCYSFEVMSIQENCDCTICQASIEVSTDEICLGDQVELTINVAEGEGPYEVLIDTDGDFNTVEMTLTSVLSGASVMVAPLMNTIYQLIAVIDESNNDEVCQNLGPAVVDVFVLPALPIEDQEICSDVTSINLVALQMNLPFIFSWSNADGDITDPTDVDPSTGPFTYSYTDGGVCTAEGTINVNMNPLPSVSISGGGIICESGTGLPSSLTLEADSGFASYLWASSDGGIIITTADPAVIVVTTGGEYQLEVIDDQGCKASTSIMIEEQDCTPCSPIMTDIESVCSDNGSYSIIINSISGGDGIGDDYTVEIPGVVQISYPTDVMIPDLVYDGSDGVQSAITLLIIDENASACQVTTYVFELNCADQEVCDCSQQNPYSINVQATADANQSSMMYVLVDQDAGGQIVAPPNQTGSFGSLADNINYVVYAFTIDLNDFSTFSALVGILREIKAGDAILTQTSSFMDVCYDWQLVELFEDCSCEPCRAELMVSVPEICFGDSIDLIINIDEGSGPYTVMIDSDGDASTAEITLTSVVNGAMVTVTPNSNSSYQIISVEDESNNEFCNSSGFVQTLVSILPNLPIEDQAVCADVSRVDLTDLEMDFPSFSFTWSDAAGVIMDPTDVDPSTGPFTYSYTDGGVCTAEGLVNYTINPLPTVSITGDSEICQQGTGSPSTLELEVDAGFSSYSWTTANGATIMGDTDGPTVSISSAGEYAVTVVDENGCIASASKVITELDCTSCSPIEAVAAAECSGDGSYSVIISSVTGGDGQLGGYSITINGSITIEYPTVTEINGLAYIGSDSKQGKVEIIIEDMDAPQCFTSLSVFEVDCREQESCDCTADQPYSIQVQASGSADDYELLYVLVDQDNAGTIIGIPNQHGGFASLPDNTNYTVYAFTVASTDLDSFLSEVNALSAISETDPLLLQQAPFDDYCYDISSVDLIEDCGCDPVELCQLGIRSIMADCNPEQAGLYEIELCLDTSNGNDSQFNVMIDGQQIGEFEYADLDADGCLMLTATELNLIADGSEGIELTVLDGPLSAASEEIYISELHYDNAGPDENEMVEITASAGTDLMGYELHLYNGSSGSTYGMPIALSGQVTDPDCGALVFEIDGLQNGPDGIALVSASGTVLDFISYEGSFLANAGPAQGLTSIDIMVTEGDATTSSQSLMLTDDGWQVSATASFGRVNEGLSCQQDMMLLCGDTAVYDEPRCIFDIALTKELSPSSIAPFNTGDAVSFDITIFNQGNVDAGEIVVSDYFDPMALSYQSISSAMLQTQLDNAVAVTDLGSGAFSLSSLALGDQVTVTIYFLIHPAFTEDIIINNAEITRATNAFNLPDIDSQPGDDAGSAPDLVNDDDPTVGNDDFDPVVINLCAGELSPPVVDELLTVCSGDIINVLIEAGKSEKPVKAASLFFSEYLEGSSRNKCLEIYNGTGDAVDLTDWSIQIYNNGNSTAAATFFPDGVVINDDDVLVICNSASDSVMLDLSDVLLNAATNFNGNDDIVLVDPEGAFIDVIGTIGSALDFGTNQSFVRNCEISEGRADGSRLFIPTDEWEIQEVDDVTDLGMHSYCATGLFPDECSYQIYLQHPATGSDPVLSGVQNDFNIDELDVALSFPQTLFITCISPTGCESNPSEISLVVQEDQALACNDRVQISLGDSCRYRVTPDLLLEADTDLSFFDVTLTREGGSVLDSAVITKTLEGETLQYQLTDLCTGNSCWGELAVEIKLRPILSSPCEFVLGTRQDIEADFSLGSRLEFQTIIESDCQDIIIDYETELKYNCGVGGPVDWCVADVTIIVSLNGEVVVSRANISSNMQIIIPGANPGDYSIVIEGNQETVTGEFNLSLQTTDCAPAQDCELQCGINESVRGGFFRDAIASNGFMSLSEAQSTLRSSCFQEVTELTSRITVDEDFCGAGTRSIISYIGTIVNHAGDSEKINLITQAYVERPAQISDIQSPLHVALPCGASTHPDSIFAYLNQANNALSDSIAISQSYPYFILKNADGDTLKRNASIEVPVTVHYQHRVDTVKVERLIDGESLLVELINKELRDSIRFDRVRQSVTRLNPIPIAEQYCGYIVDYEDIVVPACGSGVKVLRSWSIIDWCDQQFRTLPMQQIENNDDEGPAFSPLLDQDISIQTTDCSAIFELPAVVVHDDCSSTDRISLQWQTSEGRIEDGFVLDLWEDNSPVLLTLTAVDECDNRTVDSMYLHISDQIAPVASCVDELQVSITEGDLAVVHADAFDAGSHDFGCGEVWLKVIREADLRGTEVGFWNTKGPRRSPDYDLQPDPSFAYRYSCGNEEADDFRATYFDENRKVLGVDIGRQVFFDDQTSFCCADVDQTEVMVVVRVFDRDPGAGAVDPRRMVQELASPTLIPDRRNKNRLSQSTNFVENDLYGHYTDCWVKVILANKIEPEITCEDITISCTDDIKAVEIPESSGGICEAASIRLASETELSAGCSISSVVRKWYIDADDDGVFSEGEVTCTQTITISTENQLLDPFTIKWPKHFDGSTRMGKNIECDSLTVVEESADIAMGESFSCVAIDSDSQVLWCDPACSLVAYTVAIDTIQAAESCMSIIKRHSVIDWCLWTPNASEAEADQFEAVEDWAQGACTFCGVDTLTAGGAERVYFRYTEVSEDGYYEFDQILKIIDDTDPQIVVQDTFFVSSSVTQDKQEDAACDISGMIHAMAMDFCGDGNLRDAYVNWQVSVSEGDRLISSSTSFSDTIIIMSGEGSAGDSYQVEWIASDACGNQVREESIIIFEDDTKPVPVCIQGVSTASISEEEQAEIWASDFDLGSYDNCGVAHFSITGRDAEPIRPEEEGFAEQQNISLSCVDLGLVSELDVWVWDSYGNGARCPVSILLSGSCDTIPADGRTAFTIAGQIVTTTAQPLENVEVTLNADLDEYPLKAQTGETGAYSFLNNPYLQDYELVAYKDNDHLSGVTTADLVRLRSHILNIDRLASPYHLLAADINRDGNITAIDMVILTKLILGNIPNFPDNDSWRFVPADYEFADPGSPWDAPESIQIERLNRAMTKQDFIGVKVGNLTNDILVDLASTATSRNQKSVLLSTVDRRVEAGEIITLAISSTEESIAAVHTTLQHSGLELLHVATTEGSVEYQKSGETTELIWMGKPSAERKSNEVLTLKYKALESGLVSDMLSIANTDSVDDAPPSIAYLIESLAPAAVALVYEEVTQRTADILHNDPNPFKDETVIKFYLTTTQDVKLTVYDVSGTVMLNQFATGIAGHNQMAIDLTDLAGTGVLLFHVKSKELSETGKMIRLK